MNGVINFLKPPGLSSNGAVVFLRGLLGCKTGHAGTLDPGACGVLPICVGKATKISSYLMGRKKEYIAQITFGKSTDTADSYGKVIAKTNDIPKDIKSVLGDFIGNIEQKTPNYSAVKQSGKKLYQLARAGKKITPVYRNIDVYELEYLYQTNESSHMLRIVCGKGTYIRTLCEDIANNLGSLAYMSFLARTKCAGLDINNSYTIDELRKLGSSFSSALLPIDVFLSDLRCIKLDYDKREMLYNGLELKHKHSDIDKAAVYTGDELIGIGRVQDNLIKITTRLVD